MENIGKRILIILLILIGIFSVEIFSRTKTITIWSFPHILDDTRLREEISALEKKKRIKIELEYLPYEGGAHKLFTAQSVGARPDIVLGTRRVLATVGEKIELGNEYILAEDMFSMAVNVDVLKKSGIPLTKVQNITVSQFADICKALIENNIVPIELHTDGTKGDIGTLSLLQNIMGEPLFGINGKVNEQSLITALDTIRELGRIGYIRISGGSSQDDILQNFLDSKSAFMLMWSSGIEAEIGNIENIVRIPYPRNTVNQPLYISEKISLFTLDNDNELANSVAQALADRNSESNFIGYNTERLQGEIIDIDYFQNSVKHFREKWSGRLLDLIRDRRTPKQIAKELVE